MQWPVQDAKQRFSELIRTAHAEGPQVVTRHGEEIAVVVDIADYRRLKGRGHPVHGLPPIWAGLRRPRTGPDCRLSAEHRLGRPGMSYLLDTNVISEIRKRSPDPQVLAWYNSLSAAEIFISALSIGEIRQGIERLRRKDQEQADLLERWLHGLRRSYADHIVGVDAAVAEEWGRMNVPDPLPVVDGLLAATAQAHGWTLVTRNTAARAAYDARAGAATIG